MRMLAMNSLMHEAERRRETRATRRSAYHSNDAPSDEEGESDESLDELDPVDGFPSPPTRSRSRRRFVKPGKTTYELSFSRRPTMARRRGQNGYTGQKSGDAGGQMGGDANGVSQQQNDGQSNHIRPAVSSLSSVLTEVMTGKSKALSNFVDTTAPLPETVTYVIEHAADGTPYVAASDGKKYFEDSAIGQIFLKPALDKSASKGRRSDLDFLQSGGWQKQRRSDFVGGPIPERGGQTEVGDDDDDDGKKSSKTLLGFKGFQLGKKKKGSSSDLNGVVLHDNAEHANMAVLGSAEALNMPTVENEFPMLDPESVDRNRADSSWEVPAAKSEAPDSDVHKATKIELLNVPDAKVHKATVMELINVYEPQVRKATVVELQDTKAAADKQPERQTKPEGFVNSVDSTASATSSISGSSSASSDGLTNVGSAPLKTLPRLQPQKDLPAPPLAFDAYDEDDNPLCRSFQNVRDVDLMRTGQDDDDEEDDDHAHDHDESHDDAADDFPDVNSPDFAGRVRVSSGATSVADFVGGFKGQLSRRSGTSGLVNRKRAVRHARLTAEEQKAAELARKIREARNRVPLEFRDEYMSLAAQNDLQRKRKKRARGRHVHFNPNVQCREFEVESEEEDDGYDSPDEIVDAVQLVNKRDVVHAEDVVAAFPVEELEEPAEAIVRGFEAPSPPSTDAEQSDCVQDDPLTFSQLHNDKRLSFSDL